MKEKKIEVEFGILGLGRVVKSRISEVFKKEITNSKVIAVYDKNNKNSKKFSKLFKVNLSHSINSFLKKEMDFVYIATESGNHAKHIKKCFAANKNVIVEKPPVLRVDQLVNLQKIALKKKLLFYVIFQNRLNKSTVFAKKFLTHKLKKKIIFVNLKLLWCRQQNYYSDWHGNWTLDGGVIAQQGIHYIDLLCHFFGRPIKCISHLENKSNKLQAEDTSIGIITFMNGINCQVSLTTALRPRDVEASIEIVMQRKLIKLHGLCCNKLSINNKNLKNFSENVPTGYGLSHSKCLQNIIDIKLKKKNKFKPLKAIETLDTLKLLNMLYRSYEKKRWVYFNEKNLKSKLGY